MIRGYSDSPKQYMLASPLSKGVLPKVEYRSGGRDNATTTVGFDFRISHIVCSFGMLPIDHYDLNTSTALSKLADVLFRFQTT